MILQQKFLLQSRMSSFVLHSIDRKARLVRLVSGDVMTARPMTIPPSNCSVWLPGQQQGADPNALPPPPHPCRCLAGSLRPKCVACELRSGTASKEPRYARRLKVLRCFWEVC